MDNRKPVATEHVIDFICHACGHSSRPKVKSIRKPKIYRLVCPGCTTATTITEDTGQDVLEEHYRLAKDSDDIWDW